MRRLLTLTVLLVMAGCSSTTSSTSPSTTTPTGRLTGTTAPAVTATTASSTPTPPGVIPYYFRNGVIGAGQRIQTGGDAHVESVQALTKELSDVDKAAGLQNFMPSNATITKFTLE